MIYFHTSYCFLLDARVENEIFLCLQTVTTSFTCRSLQYWLRQERNIATEFRECSPPLTTDLFCWGNSFLLHIVLWININLEWHQEHEERHQEHEERTQGEKEFRTLFAKTGNAISPCVLSSCSWCHSRLMFIHKTIYNRKEFSRQNESVVRGGEHSLNTIATFLS